MFEISKGKKGEANKAILSLNDELSFANSGDIAREVHSHMNEFEHLYIQANLAQIDLTGVQLIYAIKKSCLANQKKVNINLKLGEELKKLIIVSGFKDLFES